MSGPLAVSTQMSFTPKHLVTPEMTGETTWGPGHRRYFLGHTLTLSRSSLPAFPAMEHQAHTLPLLPAESFLIQILEAHLLLGSGSNQASSQQ